jgi:hypothetical protein
MSEPIIHGYNCLCCEGSLRIKELLTKTPKERIAAGMTVWNAFSSDGLGDKWYFGEGGMAWDDSGDCNEDYNEDYNEDWSKNRYTPVEQGNKHFMFLPIKEDTHKRKYKNKDSKMSISGEEKTSKSKKKRFRDKNNKVTKHIRRKVEKNCLINDFSNFNQAENDAFQEQIKDAIELSLDVANKKRKPKKWTLKSSINDKILESSPKLIVDNTSYLSRIRSYFW